MKNYEEKLKIIQIAPHFLPVSKDLKYGGIERVVYNLDKQFVKEGHESFVIAPRNSTIEGTLCSTISQNTLILKKNKKQGWKYKNIDPNNSKFEEHCSKALEHIRGVEPDAIHDHAGFIRSQVFKDSINLPPILHTLHGPLNNNNKEKFKVLGESISERNVFFNASSKSQKKDFSKVMEVDYFVYHSIDTDNFPYQDKGEGYAFILGLIADYKGQDIALGVSRKLKKKIIIAGPIHYSVPEMKAYWEDKIKPRIDRFEEDILVSQVEEFVDWFMKSKYNSAYVGELDDAQKKEWYKRADAFYHPTKVQEAFGLVMIESMACGTPVVAYDKGPTKEIIDHGKTGYIVSDRNFDDFCNYASKVNEISRIRCRQHVQNKFTLERQLRGYLKIYRDIISRTNIFN